jgi:hypothetical protein
LVVCWFVFWGRTGLLEEVIVVVIGGIEVVVVFCFFGVL